MNESPAAAARNPFANFILGLKIILSEIQWLGLRWLRHYELRQLRKRLQEEQTALGIALAGHLADRGPQDPAREPLPPLEGDALLAYRQVTFLQQEILHLEQERRRMRQDFVLRRKSRLGMS